MIILLYVLLNLLFLNILIALEVLNRLYAFNSFIFDDIENSRWKTKAN